MPGDYGVPQYTCSNNSYCPIHNPTVWVPCLCPPKPETGPHKCPVCKGAGEVVHWVGTTVKIEGDPKVKSFKQCHGCFGKGWVTV